MDVRFMRMPKCPLVRNIITICVCVCVQRAGLLLDRAPELTHLSVTECQLSHTHQNKQWKVTSLELTGLEQDMEHIGRLPTCGAGTVDVCMGSTDCRLGTVICTLQREDNVSVPSMHVARSMLVAHSMQR